MKIEPEIELPEGFNPSEAFSVQRYAAQKISSLKARALRGGAGLRGIDDRPVHTAEVDDKESEEEGEEEVMKDTAKADQKALPAGAILEASPGKLGFPVADSVEVNPGVLLFLFFLHDLPVRSAEIPGARAVLSEHRAGAPEGQKLKAVPCISKDPGDKPRAHSDGELQYADAAGLRHKKMSELMEKDQKPQRKNRNDNTQALPSFLFLTNSLAHFSASRISERSGLGR